MFLVITVSGPSTEHSHLCFQEFPALLQVQLQQIQLLLLTLQNQVHWVEEAPNSEREGGTTDEWTPTKNQSLFVFRWCSRWVGTAVSSGEWRQGRVGSTGGQTQRLSMSASYSGSELLGVQCIVNKTEMNINSKIYDGCPEPMITANLVLYTWSPFEDKNNSKIRCLKDICQGKECAFFLLQKVS